MATQSLYERLGGVDGISALVDVIVAAHLVNPAIKARFLPIQEKPEQLANAKRHLVTFLCAGGGGPEKYAGRNMLDAHRGLNISATEYMAAIDDILASMKKRSIDEETAREVLAIAYSLKDQIVHV